MGEAQLRACISKRGVIKGQLTRFKTFLDNVQENTRVAELSLRLDKINNVWTSFDNCQSEIEVLDPTEAQFTERQNFESLYFETIAIASEVIKEKTSQLETNQTVNSSTHSSNVKLPILQLPEFKGQYEEYKQFADTFKALIDDNPSINKIQSFYYLKSCLKCEAANIIQNLQISEVNYDIAWQLLKERFDNSRIAVNKHIQTIVELPLVVRESSVALRSLLDNFQKSVLCLKGLGQKTDTWDSILIYLASSKLDTITKREWENSIKQNAFPTLDEFVKFLTYRCHVLETVQASNVFGPKQSIKTPTPINIKGSFNKSYSHLAAQSRNCEFCNEAHFIFTCHKFRELPIQSRINEVKRLKLCLNCLRSGHFLQDCRSSPCKICRKRHNTHLHLNERQTTSGIRPASTIETSSTNHETHSNINTHCSGSSENYIGLLSTALVHIFDNKGNPIQVRALLDSGSQSNFISESLVKKLNIPLQKISVPVMGINQAKTNVSFKINARVKSLYNEYNAYLDYLVLSNITGQIPGQSFLSNKLNIPANLKLADPRFNESSSIDILLGAAVYFDLMCIGQIKLGINKPILQKSKLGWLIGGPMQFFENNQTNVHHASIDITLHDKIEQFWKIEEISPKRILSIEEQECEHHFLNNYSIMPDGHFEVKLPTRDNMCLGESLEVAIKRCTSIERRCDRDNGFKEYYTNFMHEYEALGHMSKINNLDLKTSQTYYMPHQGVIKSNSTTTKLRVVFDASAKSSNGNSLNDMLKVGPTIQDELFAILIRFRKHNIVLTADIAKMYRQINIDETQRDLQRIVWRFDRNQPFSHYRLNTVTYGTASASFLAIRCLQQIGNDNAHIAPEISNMILHDFYVDDLITGTSTLEEAIIVKRNMTDLLMRYGFDLRKWMSNSRQVLNEDEVKSNNFEIKPEGDSKTLGIYWDSDSDILKYVVSKEPRLRITKRSILSVISQVFDPIELIAPVVLKAKIILQLLWKCQIGWDESVPAKVHTTFLSFCKDLPQLEEFRIDRHALPNKFTFIELHGFSDASELAYGACVYIRAADESGNLTSSLLCSKSRVAPLKVVSLPRLELCGAVLLTKLLNHAEAALKLNITRTYYWTDSRIVLAWLAAEPSTWKTFVANRVCEIQEKTVNAYWRHVPSGDNPADLVSRGTSAKTLKTSELWWHGPVWLNQNESCWPNFEIEVPGKEQVPERRAQKIVCHVAINDFNICARYSSLSKLQNVTAFCFRFCRNARGHNKVSGDLTNEEIDNATRALIRIAQRESLQADITELQKSSRVKPNSKILSLHPFLDTKEILRVGGRLKHSNLSYDQKHQILLPNKHYLTELIIRHEHNKLKHAGPQMVLASLRSHFWIVNGRSTARFILKKCVICSRLKPTVFNPIMGNLPAHRVRPSRPFQIVGVDYAGPFSLKDGVTRSRKIVKTFVCIFVCFSTKAIHIELASDLSSNSFMNCLKRFVSRRGLCSDIYSDNGTNFVGANNELKSIHETLSRLVHETPIKNYLFKNRIKWHFIPPRAPHFGGLWESAVKSCKRHLKIIVENANLHFEAMSTLLTQIEAILNSRPLTPLSSDPHDLHPLTPGHFLIGSSLLSLPQVDITDVPCNRLTKYQQLQQMVQHFWARWQSEYLVSLQQRNKWKSQQEEVLKIGAMVLIKEPNLPPMKRSLGRILEVFPGTDNVNRVALVKTASGPVKRAFSKLCALPID